MPWNVTLNETNYDWLFDMSVKRPHGRALTNESGHLFQTFIRQSEGLATRDYSPIEKKQSNLGIRSQAFPLQRERVLSSDGKLIRYLHVSFLPYHNTVSTPDASGTTK